MEPLPLNNTPESPLIFGKYKIIREIGRSNDIVYEAEDPILRRRVALKELILPPNLSEDQKKERIERFYREAKAAGRLTHPNIVLIYEVGEFQGRHFIAMEYLEGQSLRQIIQQRKNLSIDEAIEIALQVCDALSYAHARRVIHRDIKPDNVHILPNGKVKITDFGIARFLDEPSITVDGQIFGTPSYMSPEQIVGKELDQRTDIFSLGVMLYEMITGQKPFTGESIVTITHNILNGEPPFSELLPSYIDAIVRKAIAKNVEDRYNNAAELAFDLRSKTTPNIVGQSQTTIGANQTQYATQSSQPSYPSSAQKQASAPISIPPLPIRKKILSLSSSQKNILLVAFTAIFLAGSILLLILAVNLAYEGYKNQVANEKAARHLAIGSQLFKNADYESALEQFTRAIQLSPSPQIAMAARQSASETCLRMGQNAEKNGDYTLALNYYNQATDLDPKSAKPRLMAGDLYYKLGNYNAALQSWMAAFQTSAAGPFANAARSRIGVYYFEQAEKLYISGNHSAAIQYWQKAAEIASGTEIGQKAQERLMSISP